MFNTRISLEKFLSTMVPEKYPEVFAVEVRERDENSFNVYLAVKFVDIYGRSNSDFDFADEIRNYVRKMSKYILDNDGIIYAITFYDPDYL